MAFVLRRALFPASFAAMAAAQPDAVARELALALERDVEDLLRIRKTDDTPAKYSVADAIMIVKQCSVRNAAKEFRRLRERYGGGM